MAIPCPSPGIERKRPPATTPIAGLLLAGDWTDTGLPSCMESAVYSARRAAEVIWRSLGAVRQLALPVKKAEGFAGLLRRILPRPT
jgi:15-cis-phytoene desaturase